MFGKRTKRMVSTILVALFLTSAGVSLAAGNSIGNQISGDGTLYSTLINGRKVARQAYLSDRYPTTDGRLRVFHNRWKEGSWEKNDETCRISGSMSLNGTAYMKAVGLYLDGGAFRSSAEGTEQSGVVQYTLNGEYDEFYFGIGPDDSDSRYCGTDDGSARIQIYLDNVLVYDTDYFAANSVGYDQAISVRGANKMKIVLSERKGSNNTLNVLLTDPLLVDFA